MIAGWDRAKSNQWLMFLSQGVAISVQVLTDRDAGISELVEDAPLPEIVPVAEPEDGKAHESADMDLVRKRVAVARDSRGHPKFARSAGISGVITLVRDGRLLRL